MHKNSPTTFFIRHYPRNITNPQKSKEFEMKNTTLYFMLIVVYHVED